MAFSRIFGPPFRPAFDAGQAAAVALAPVAGSWLWLKADAISGSDGDAVTTWTDSSANGRNFDGTGHAPTLKTVIINGRSVVRNATTAYMLLPSALPTTNTIFVVSVFRTAPATVAGLMETARTGTTAETQPKFLLQLTSAGAVRTLDNLSYAGLGTATVNVPFRVTMTHNAGSSTRSGWFNGTSAYSGIGYALTGYNQQINVHSGYYYPYLGDIAEIIVYDSVLSGPNLAINEAYLADKYAL